MIAHLTDMLLDVVEEVISAEAFAFVDPCGNEDLIANTDTCLSVQIGFEGSVSGLLKWVVPEAISADLAVNILGLDDTDEVEKEDARDAVQELLNVICGQMLTRLFGSEPIFRLSIPHTEEADASQWQELSADSQMIGVSIDDVPTALCVTFAENTP